MAVSLSSVDGLISGMSTSQVISQLMQIEAAPQTRLSTQYDTINSTVTSYQSVNTKFLAFQSAADKLTHADNWVARTATSSSSSVSASATNGALTGAVTFDVQQVAKAQAYVSNATYASTSATATTETSLTITKGAGTPVNVSTGDGSLAAVVSGINAANAGVKAAAVQVAPGSFRLQLTSTTTGADSNFSIAAGANATPLGALNETIHGQDATLLVGDPLSAGKYTVSSHTNTFAGVLPGVTLSVSAPATNVTVQVDAAAAQLTTDVLGMVNAANAVLAEIKKQTAWDPATKTGAPLVGDSTMRQLQQDVLGMVTDTVGGNGSLATAGVQLAKDGTIAFDGAKFRKAFDADAEATAKLFLPGGSTTHVDPAQSALAGKISFFSASDQTVRGAYDVKITQAATRASRDLTGTIAGGETVTLTVPGKTAAVVTAQPGDDLDALATRINDASASGSLGVFARVESGTLVVRASGYGPTQTFSITTNAAALTVGGLVAGKDVAGSVNGIVGVGSGQALVMDSEAPQLRGMALLVTATADDVTAAAAQAGANANLFGTFSYKPGLAQRFDSLASDAVRTGTGRLSSLISGKQKQMTQLALQITDWDSRLAAKEARYKTQYANLETALGKLKSQSTWLSGQLSSLPTSA